MNLENTQRIIAACPSLFVNMDSERESMLNGSYFGPIAFGFECGDGWVDLLVELCEKIQTHLKTLPDEEAVNIVALQVKEKFGTLRFYISGYDDVIDKFISEAVNKSANTCEVCGAPGSVLGDGWLYAACSEHSRE